jgi:chromosome segregation ATPase
MVRKYSMLAGGYVDIPDHAPKRSEVSGQEVRRMMAELGAQLVESDERRLAAEEAAGDLRARLAECQAKLAAAESRADGLERMLAAAEAACTAANTEMAAAHARLHEANSRQAQPPVIAPATPIVQAKPVAYDVMITSRDAKGRLGSLELIPKTATHI